MTVVIAYNPASGSGRAEATARAIEVGLGQAGVPTRTIASRREDASGWLRPALDGATAVVVAGGDGAVRSVAGEVARAAVPLWHAPSGTENLFARHFSMGAEPASILSALQRNATRSIDLGCAGEAGRFAIMASVGFDADVVHALGRMRRGAISHASYLPAMYQAMRGWSPSELRWEIDGERESLGRGLVVVGNLPEYGARLDPAADAVADDGLLDAVFLPADGALDALSWMPLLWMGLHRAHPGRRERRAASIRIQAADPVRLQLDGDPAGPPEGLRVVSLSVGAERLRILAADG